MESYTVVIEGEFTECVQANNPEEAEQLAIRLVTLSVGFGTSGFTVTDSKICPSPSQGEKNADDPS